MHQSADASTRSAGRADGKTPILRRVCGEKPPKRRAEDVIRHDAAGLPARDPQDAAGRWHSRGELDGCSSRIYVLFTL